MRSGLFHKDKIVRHFGGYNLQLTALKGQKLEAFDPSSFVVGLGVSIGVGR